MNALPQQRHTTRPMTRSAATPIPFVYLTVDDPNSNWNEVTAINNLSKIVGVYGGGQSSSMYMSYTSQPPYAKMPGMNDPGAQGTFVTSLSNTRMDAGYVYVPAGHSGIWGFVRIHGLWTLIEDPNVGTSTNEVTELLGVNDANQAVGFYQNTAGTKIPTVLDITHVKFTDLQPVGSTGDAAATGINGKGDICGWMLSSQGFISFFDTTGTYYPIWFKGAKSTFATSINYSDQIAGSYIDSGGMTHGFVLTGPTWGGKSQIWQTVDEPNATGGTWVTGINSHDDISGYYVDSTGIQHGFVASPK
ncbi:MAG TPA: hypothetical protein VEW74_01185 [Candidatus Nitrosotalea sp.]|nr:hypothetical protein [Candidatus Nitrosotalea sp.]